MELKEVKKMASKRIKELTSAIKEGKKVEVKWGIKSDFVPRLITERAKIKQIRSFINSCSRSEL